ncbi:hypothetical protein V8E51_019280 [Hyaloscypha variabilis]
MLPEKPSRETVEAEEWKYTGYPIFSQFLSSDNDFLILRRFGTLATRDCSRQGGPPIHNGSFRGDAGSLRANLLRGQIYEKLKMYQEFMLLQAQLRNKPSIPPKDVNSVKTWFKNHVNAISEPESRYIDQNSDLIQLVPKTKTPLRRLLERSQRFRLWQKWHVKREDLEGHDPHHEIYTSDEHIEAFVTLTIGSVGLAMLIAPLWILNFVDGPVTSLAIITSFIVLFMCLVSFASVAKPFESLGATAAYSAVLMVFLQMGNK